MSVASDDETPVLVKDVDTPEAVGKRPGPGDGVPLPGGVDREMVEEEVFEDASDAGEVFIRRDIPHPPRQPVFPTVVSNPPHIKPEMYDGTTDWSEYCIYFDQLAELYNWDDERKAMVLGISLKGEARVVLASLDAAQRRSYMALTNALAQSFAPKELVHLYQAELKARKKKGEESMVDLGRDVAKLVRLAYPTADAATREVIGINAFLEALPGPASEMKLHVIKGRPRNLQEAVAHATEVDAVVEAESRKTSRRRGDVRMVGADEADLQGEMKQLRLDLERTKAELRDARKEAGSKRREKRPLQDVTCYQCGKKGHYKRNCPQEEKKTPQEENQNQGNGSRRLDR